MKLRLLAAALLAITTLTTPAPAVAATNPDDPAAGQIVDESQGIATDEVVISEGHIDIGPHYVDGDWTLLAHDDTAEPSTWRHLDKTVLKITDAAMLTVPDDPAYAFIGAEPGADVYVVPQTQASGVAWLGWNTQDPTVMSTIDRGVSLGLGRVEGPGELIVYLQSGSFEAPDPLWDSRSADNEPLWVDVNTHTHANWVFTEPGVYLVEATASADLIDGSAVTDTRIIRFAVGEGTNTGDALVAAMPSRGDSDQQENATEVPIPEEDNTLVTLLTIAIAAVALLLIAGVVVVVVRGRNAKRRATAARARS
jgi:surface-anchored protein